MAHKERHTASKKKGGAVKILLAVVLLLVLAAGAAGVFAYNEIHGNGKPGTEVTVSIPQGSGVASIANRLKEAGRHPLHLPVPLVCGAEGGGREAAIR